MVSGHARFDFGPAGATSVEMEAGAIVHVPARLVHCDVNPDPERENVWVLVMAGSGPVAVDVEGPEAR